MSFSLDKLFKRKDAKSAEGADPAIGASEQDSLVAGSMADSFQNEGMYSVQGDPSQPSQFGDDDDFANQDVVSLPLLGRASPAAHQRKLLLLLGIGLVVLALIAGWVLQQSNRVAQQLTATGQSLMQSQRLAKAVSQALVGANQAFPDVKESSTVLGRNVNALNSGDSELGVQSLGDNFKADLDAISPGRARRAQRQGGDEPAEDPDPGG